MVGIGGEVLNFFDFVFVECKCDENLSLIICYNQVDVFIIGVVG